MNRKGKVSFEDHYCGIIEETDNGYQFSYSQDYLNDPWKQLI